MRPKAEVIAEYGDNEKDSGKPEVQIALLDQHIKHLT
jgi:ribosomal protein S15P/S13E